MSEEVTQVEAVDPAYLARIRKTASDGQRAQQQFQAAQQGVLLTQGAMREAQAAIQERYGLVEGDSWDSKTGVITRAAKPEPAVDLSKPEDREGVKQAIERPHRPNRAARRHPDALNETVPAEIV